MNLLVILTDTGISKDDIVSKLIPNFWSFLTQLIAFIVLLIIVIFVAYKPVKQMLKKRQDYIEANIADAEKAKAESIISLREAKESVLESKRTANEILQKAEQTAKTNSQLAIEQTNQEISLMKQRASEDIEKAKEEAKEEIRKEIVSVALLASSEVLKREVNEKDNQRLVEKFIEDLDE
jgi:F-type H+-transporting ATPase subunit b